MKEGHDTTRHEKIDGDGLCDNEHSLQCTSSFFCVLGPGAPVPVLVFSFLSLDSIEG